MNLLLFRLHLRRALHPGLALLLVGTAILVIVSRGPQAEVVGAGADSRQLLRGLLRTDVAFALLAVLVPLLLASVAGCFGRIDARERHWLLPRKVSRSAIVVSAWAGAWIGALLWLAAIGALCELAADGSEPSLRASSELEMEDVRRIGDEGKLGWLTSSAERPAGSVARLSLGLFGAYEQVDRFELSSHGAPAEEAFAVGTAQPGMRTIVEVALPPGSEDVWLEFHARGATGTLTLHDTELQLFVPAGERAGTFHFLLRAALALGGSLAIALGLGAWLRPASLLLLILGGYGLLWLEADSLAGSVVEAWVPGFDLPGAMTLLSQGRSAGTLPIETWLGTAVLVLVGLSLFRLALGRWRLGT